MLSLSEGEGFLSGTAFLSPQAAQGSVLVLSGFPQRRSSPSPLPGQAQLQSPELRNGEVGLLPGAALGMGAGGGQGSLGLCVFPPSST